MKRSALVLVALLFSANSFAISDEQKAYAYSAQGQSAYSRGNYSEAIDWYAEAIALDIPLNNELHFNYALALQANSQPEQALAEMTRYLALTGDSGEHFKEATDIHVELTKTVQDLEIKRQSEKMIEDARKAELEREKQSRLEQEKQERLDKLRSVALLEIDQTMVTVPAGSFLMGAEPSMVSVSRANELPQHRVTLPSYRLGKYEVTQAQWKAVMDSNPSVFSGCGDKCPIDNISWDDAQQFILKLNEISGHVYRLPSESEWEYAARAGTQTAFYLGTDIQTDRANCSGCTLSPPATTEVGKYWPNSFGFYDMHGNVWEWVQDTYVDSYKNHKTDGSAVETSDATVRVLRGGSWLHPKGYARSAYRNREATDVRLPVYGLRLAESVIEKVEGQSHE